MCDEEVRGEGRCGVMKWMVRAEARAEARWVRARAEQVCNGKARSECRYAAAKCVVKEGARGRTAQRGKVRGRVAHGEEVRGDGVVQGEGRGAVGNCLTTAAVNRAVMEEALRGSARRGHLQDV